MRIYIIIRKKRLHITRAAAQLGKKAAHFDGWRNIWCVVYSFRVVAVNILICDDMPNEAEKLSDLLNGLGYKSVAFLSAVVALEHIRSGAAADMCILDIVMPEMNGIELALMLRNSFDGKLARHDGRIVSIKKTAATASRASRQWLRDTTAN